MNRHAVVILTAVALVTFIRSGCTALPEDFERPAPPRFVTRLGSVTRLMNNKPFAVDNQITILGGRDIGNEYFDADPDLEFADLDVMAIGPVAGQGGNRFFNLVVQARGSG